MNEVMGLVLCSYHGTHDGMRRGLLITGTNEIKW